MARVVRDAAYFSYAPVSGPQDHRRPPTEGSTILDLYRYFDGDDTSFVRSLSDLDGLATHFVKRSYLEGLARLPRMQDIPAHAFHISKCRSPIFISHHWLGPYRPDDRILDTVRSFVPDRGEVGVWIDYCCVPQPRRDGTDDRSELHKGFFKVQLAYIPTILLKSQVIVLWDEGHVDRAWCVVELLLTDIFKNVVMKQVYHRQHQLIDPVTLIVQTYRPSEYCVTGGVAGKPVTKMLLPHALKDLAARYYNSLLNQMGLQPMLLTDLLRRVQPEHVDHLFEENGLRCTNHHDIQVLKNLLLQACRFAGAYDVEAIKWQGKIPFSDLYPYMMGDCADFAVRFGKYDFV